MNPDRLRREVEAEFSELIRVRDEVLSLLRDAAGRTATVRETAAAGAFAAQFYSGVENILKRFVKHLDGVMPSGDDWHIRLVEMFTEGSASGMPVLLAGDEKTTMALFRRLRHVARNTYGHALSWDRLVPALESMARCLAAFQRRVSDSIGQMDS